MNKKFLRLFCLSIILIFISSSCGSAKQGDVISLVKADERIQVNPESTDMNKLYKENVLSKTFETQVDLLNDKLFSLKNNEENMVYSPLSIYLALALAANGSDGNTLKQFQDLMAFPELTTLREDCQKVQRLLSLDNEIEKLDLNSSLWVDKELELKNDYLKQVGQMYADLNSCDFSSKETLDTIRKWLNDHTGEKLGNDYTPQEETVLLILNAIYFKSQWDRPFNAATNLIDDFTLAAGSKKSVTFMTQQYDAAYFENEDCQIANRPLYGKTNMYFILPKEGKTTAAIQDISTLIQECSNSKNHEVNLALPKYTIQSDWDLIDLKKLGLLDCFSDQQANFSNMSTTPLFISKAQHDGYFSLNEDGIEAAGFTSIELDKSSAFYDETEVVNLKLDRPFIFVVTYGAIPLFTGICADPD